LKNILLIYNPKSGDGNFRLELDNLIAYFQDEAIMTVLRLGEFELVKRFSLMEMDRYDAIIIAGGDGTVSWVAESLIINELDIPFYIIPVGTSNDFAEYLKFSTEVDKIYDIIINGRVISVDSAVANNSYFINVCAGGFLTNVPHSTDVNMKNRLGNLAYYIRGIQELPKINPLTLRIETGVNVFEEDLFLFLIINSGRAGGFKDLSPLTDISDGKFEFIAIKYGKIYEMFNALIEVFINKNLSGENIIHLQSDYFYIENIGDDLIRHTDIDGERGPDYPVEIKVVQDLLSLYIK